MSTDFPTKATVPKPLSGRYRADRMKYDIRSSKGAKIRRGLAICWARRLTLLTLDAALIAFAWRFAVTFGTQLDSPWTQAEGMHLLPLVVAIGVAVISANGLYKSSDYRRNYSRLFSATAFACLLLLLIAFLYEPNRYVSRSTFLLFWFLSSTFLFLGRLSCDVIVDRVRKQGAIRHAVFLICNEDEREKCVALINQCNDYSILGVADSSILNEEHREDMVARLRELNIEEVFVSWRSIANRLHLCWHFRSSGIALRILIAQDRFLLSRSESFLTGGVASLKVATPIFTGSEFWLKRCLDFCTSALLILLLLPVYLLIALLIRLDSPGPIFFRQVRVGLHGKEFKVWKFRTMVTDADKLQAALEAKNEVKDGVLFKMKEDPRVTRVGRFLRAYSLDELPQLFNVLLGEMSIVGPRPLPIRDVQRFKEHHFIRQEVLPGITGLWQVSGRSNITSFEDAVALDITYIVNWTLLLDLKIILKTIQVVLQKTGAY